MIKSSAIRACLLTALGIAQAAISAASPQLLAATGKFTVQTALAAAEKGDPKARYFLAKCCAAGKGLPQDYAKAAEYMRNAAEQGYSHAQNDLASMYARGEGVERNYDEAARWYRKAADQGDPLGEY